jgi:hypothetical protein
VTKISSVEVFQGKKQPCRSSLDEVTSLEGSCVLRGDLICRKDNHSRAFSGSESTETGRPGFPVHNGKRFIVLNIKLVSTAR